jgi:hypothetical protein
MKEFLKVSEECLRFNSNFPNIHYTLKSYLNNAKFIWTLHNSLYDDFGFGGLVESNSNPFLSQKTLKRLLAFHESLEAYRKENLFSSDGVFMQFDKNWLTILKTKLIPALDSMEDDFELNNVNFVSYKVDYKPEARPSDDEIIEQINLLYKLLHKNKIIEKYDPD